MWVERFAVPATRGEQVHFLLWIAARIHEVVPIAWARFEAVDEGVRARADGTEDREPFVLAGNPLAERYRRDGEAAALAWAVAQSAWSRRELAGMLVELALEHDPDHRPTAQLAEQLLRRALGFDPMSDAVGYLAIVLVRQRRAAEAIALAAGAPGREVRLLVVEELVHCDPGRAAEGLELLDAPTLGATEPDILAALVHAVARHAPSALAPLLARLPRDGALVPHLYNASFHLDAAAALEILRAVIALPVPPPDAGEAREAYAMSWNNACIAAHALGRFALAVELAVEGQPYAAENPNLYHSAACAHAAVGANDRALAQIQLAIEHGYANSERMETDSDLAPLRADPRFAAIFVEWRTRRADLN
jgi:hypothetical protein